MPHKRCNIQAFNFHEAGASSCLYATQHHQLITGGKKGFIGIWDMRHTQRQIHFFKAHDHPIKCLAIDPNEEFIVTGAVDGDIKVNDWKVFFLKPNLFLYQLPRPFQLKISNCITDLVIK